MPTTTTTAITVVAAAITTTTTKDRIIHHATMLILESLFEKQFIFHTCLRLLLSIIDSYGEGDKQLPIGNLTSQFFANFYLSSMDHLVLEKLKPQGYVQNI